MGIIFSFSSALNHAVITLPIQTSKPHIPFGEHDVARLIMEKSKEYGIDKKMLYTIASIESGFEPLAITVETTKEKAEVLKTLASKDIKIKTGRTYHSKIWIVSIYPNNYDIAVFIIEHLERLGFSFDVGLMQINTCNFTLSEVKKMFVPSENLDKACKHLKGCIKKYKKKVHQVECYNRGAGNLNKMLKTQKRYYPYWERYKRHYKSYFE